MDHVTLLVTSFDASMPYYDALLPLLGFAKERDHVWHDGAGFYFQFREAKPDTRPYERFGAGMNHLGFAAPDVETVEQVRAAMRERGFPVPEIQEIGGATALFMKDPDGSGSRSPGIRPERRWSIEPPPRVRLPEPPFSPMPRVTGEGAGFRPC